MDWYNIVIFGVIPIASVTLMYFIKRKLLWIAPLISTILAVVVTIIDLPTILTYGEHRAMFFILVVPGHFVIGIILTVIAYVVGYILKQKKTNIAKLRFLIDKY